MDSGLILGDPVLTLDFKSLIVKQEIQAIEFLSWPKKEQLHDSLLFVVSCEMRSVALQNQNLSSNGKEW